MSSLEVDFELIRVKLGAAHKLISEAKELAGDHGMPLTDSEVGLSFSQLQDLIEQCGWSSSSYNC